MDTTLEGDDSEFDDEELNDETPESPDTKRDVKRAMKEDESEKLVSILHFRYILQDEPSFFEAVNVQVCESKTARPPRGQQVSHQRLI